MRNVTLNERIYLEAATLNVCGTKKCSLNGFNEFECACPFGMQRSEDGLCTVQKPCLPGGNGYSTCTENKNQFCSVRAGERDNYACRCEQSVGYNLQRTCNDYTAKFEKPGQVTHSLSMKVRLDWSNETFFSLFANQILNLLNPKLERRLPDFAIREFINYEQDVFRSYANYAFYQPILEDKLRTVLHDGLAGFAHLKNCGHYTIYPMLSYNRSSFELTRLINTVFDVTYQIYCANALDERELLDKFTNEYLVQDYIENYFYLNQTGIYVIPDSIRMN